MNYHMLTSFLETYTLIHSQYYWWESFIDINTWGSCLEIELSINSRAKNVHMPII